LTPEGIMLAVESIDELSAELYEFSEDFDQELI
jgi:hypothetical protein